MIPLLFNKPCKFTKNVDGLSSSLLCSVEFYRPPNATLTSRGNRPADFKLHDVAASVRWSGWLALFKAESTDLVDSFQRTSLD
jgi:hypothetical protein